MTQIYVYQNSGSRKRNVYTLLRYIGYNTVISYSDNFMNENGKHFSAIALGAINP